MAAAPHMRGGWLTCDGNNRLYMSASDTRSSSDQQELEKSLLERRLLASADERAAGSGRISRLFPIGTALLLMLMVAQTLYLFRHQAVSTELIASTSRLLGFTPPQRRSPEQIGLTNRVFTEVESEAGLYRLQLALINHASHSQLFPQIEVSLTDVKGVTKARNLFHARDYLPAHTATTQIAPNEQHAISFFIRSSATDVSGFMLEFF